MTDTVKRKDVFWSALHLIALFNFAVAQPVYDLLGRNPTFFIAHHPRPVDIVLMVLVLSLAAPLLLVLLELLVGVVGDRWRRGLHFGFVGVLAALILLPIFKGEVQYLYFMFVRDLPSQAIGDVVLLVLLAFSATGFVWLYARYAVVRSFVSLLSFGIVLFPVWFLCFTPMYDLVFKDNSENVAPNVTVERSAPVVIIVFDELNSMSLLDSEHRINSLRFPNIARFASDATWFRNATTSSGYTLHAVPSLLTGKSPQRGLMPDRVNHPNNLFSLLFGSHRLQVSESMTRLCPDIPNMTLIPLHTRMTSLFTDITIVYGRMVTPEGAARWWPDIDAQWGNFVATGVSGSEHRSLPESRRYYGRAGRFRKFLDRITRQKEDTVYYLHILLPHVNYEFLPSGRPYDGPGLGVTIGYNEDWLDDEWAVLQSQQRYLLQLEFTDRLVGELIDRLQEIGIYDESLVMLVSDHGVSFRTGHSRRAVSHSNPQDILPILWMVKTPHQRQSAVSDRNVESIDLLPTVADVLGIEIPWPTDGQSALDQSLPGRLRKE